MNPSASPPSSLTEPTRGYVDNPSWISGIPRRKRPEERDYLEILLACVLVVLAIQAIYCASIWGLAWVGLGSAALVIKRRMSVPFLLIVEAPVFHAILSYSATVMYLAQEENVYDLVHDPSLNEAIWMAWGGMACYLIGLAWALGKKWGQAMERPPEIKMTEKQAVVLCVFGLICSDILAPVVPGPIRVVMIVFGYGTPLALFILLKLYTQAGIHWMGTWKFFFWVTTLIWWAVRSVVGGIFGSTILILLIFTIQFAQKSRLVLVGFCLCVGILAPTIQDTKSDYRHNLEVEGKTSGRTLKDVFVVNFKEIFIKGDFTTYREGITALAYRLCTFDIWQRVKQHMDIHQDFAGGQTVKDALITSFTPRIFWSSKPITGGSSDLAIQYADMMLFEGTSVGVGLISEFYINGGIWAVLIGMLVIGCLAGIVLNRGSHDHVQPLGVMMAISVIACLVRPEANLSDVLGGIVRLIFLWWMLRAWVLRLYLRNRRLLIRRGLAGGAPG